MRLSPLPTPDKGEGCRCLLRNIPLGYGEWGDRALTKYLKKSKALRSSVATKPAFQMWNGPACPDLSLGMDLGYPRLKENAPPHAGISEQ